jgi:transcriptional regulator with XRE-family HTH domain
MLNIRLVVPTTGNRAIVLSVPRTDENGRQLKALLDYLFDGDVEAKEIYDALGVSSSTYYRRIKENDYPDAEELRRVADAFGLSFPDLQVRFGLMTHQEVRSYFESAPVTVATVRELTTTTRRAKLTELKPRQDAPPL